MFGRSAGKSKTKIGSRRFCSKIALLFYRFVTLTGFLKILENTRLTVGFRTLDHMNWCTVKILKFGTPQTIAITVLKIEKFDIILH